VDVLGPRAAKSMVMFEDTDGVGGHRAGAADGHPGVEEPKMLGFLNVLHVALRLC
jgi:hypothetical protein